MTQIPQDINREHVLDAIAAMDQDGAVADDFGSSTQYDLLHNGKRYPPKAVIGLAAEYATGTRLQPSQFSSGIGAGQACRVLHDLGFRIVDKHSDHDVFDTPSFVVGKSYRRQALHDRYGGQRQGGISTPKDHPLVLLIIGKAGSLYGYRDGFRADGIYW